MTRTDGGNGTGVRSQYRRDVDIHTHTTQTQAWEDGEEDDEEWRESSKDTSDVDARTVITNLFLRFIPRLSINLSVPHRPVA